MIELFSVPPGETDAFVAAWAAEAAPGSTLHRALGGGAPVRFASMAAGVAEGDGGVLLIVPFDVPAGEAARVAAAWEAACAAFAGRRGHLGAHLLEDRDGRLVGVVHWSSPLMYARAVREDGDLVAALPGGGRAALYVRAAASPPRPVRRPRAPRT